MQGGRARLAAVLVIAPVLFGMVLRLLLAASFDGAAPVSRITLALLLGAVSDLAVSLVVLTPALLALSLLPLRRLARPRVRTALLSAYFAVLCFATAVQYFFFDEFNARLNHLALDYLTHPKEVVGNVWQSYDVPFWLAVAALAGIALAMLTSRILPRVPAPPRPRRGRALAGALVLLATGTAVAALHTIPAAPSGDRVTDEIAGNDLESLWRAFRTASLDFAAFYRTLPVADARLLAASTLGFPPPAAPGAPPDAFSLQRPAPRPSAGKGWDVVVLVEESLGSEFIGVLGHPERRTSPGFDRWSREGLLLTQLVATGNRTVRGLEATLCSFPPLPGEAILKRDRSQDVATLARVFGDLGYRTTFVYGGWGLFDGMKGFMTQNGYQDFVERDAFPGDAFHTIWGVADEVMLDKVLDLQLAAQASGRKVFVTALTVSNHKPFRVPERGTAWPATQRMRETGVAYADWALARYLDRAKEAGLLAHTLVLVVGDHGARVYGATEIPAASYRIPALFLVPDPAWHGRRIDRLASQIDLAPTLLDLAGVETAEPFFGSSVLGLPADGGRAFLHHDRDFGILTDDALVVLGLGKTVRYYRREGKDVDVFQPVAGGARDPRLRRLEDQAIAVFQTAAELYEHRRFALPGDLGDGLLARSGGKGPLGRRRTGS
ncbi:MAG TPA: LTA synthase family protein [Candidatus Polarisedimenticolaceae bacterium]|nr:LTA synthase family protein [Candidatus Polarisedimenticolaceae bacterium]